MRKGVYRENCILFPTEHVRDSCTISVKRLQYQERNESSVRPLNLYVTRLYNSATLKGL